MKVDMIDMHMFISTTPQFQETSENLSLFQTPGTQSHEAITSSLGQKKYVWKEFEPFGHFGCFSLES